MNHTKLKLCICITVLIMTLALGETSAQDSNLVVRIIRLKVDSTQVDAFMTALKDEMQTSIRIEPGVLTLNVAVDKQNPTDITLLEVYLDDNAFKSHLAAPHFDKYKAITKDMVKSREVVDANPILLWTKQNKSENKIR